MPYLDHSPNYMWFVLVPKVPDLIETDKGEGGKEGEVLSEGHVKRSTCQHCGSPGGCQLQSGHGYLTRGGREPHAARGFPWKAAQNTHAEFH